ncbi:F-box domain-containing protein [Mycena venus]|uniref:F-box domain-containing protein n=1 Tax=Mycena venus TaxID=2733690 RepID=A0A8H6XYU8_9AGAR|nr:F-box domain-containing protein [Mycena venus]
MSTEYASSPEESQKVLLQDLLRSHSQLPPRELSSLFTSLTQQLSQCDEELARLGARMRELSLHRGALQEQYAHCRSLLAPVRRLPTEILTQIFALHRDGCESDSVVLWHTNTGFMALYTLAQAPLLALSQVCARWHGIALGTPSLWTKIRLDTALWRTPITTKKAMRLLQSALTRGSYCPLTVLVTNHSGPPSHGPALELLAQHSARWRAATFKCAASDLCHLSSIKGNLPTLETLEVFPTSTDVEPVTLFEVAPRLSSLAIADMGLHVSTPPFAQVHKIQYVELPSTDIRLAVSTMSHLSEANIFSLQFYLDDWTSHRSHNIDLDIPHTSSDVGHLSIELLGQFFRHHCQQALGGIFAGLTLPLLRELTFKSEIYSRFPFVWPQQQFLALCQRSSFHTHLQSLSLFHVHITEAHLLQCLPLLPALINLAIADHERIRGRGVNLTLITDTLLRALTLTSTNPDADLVPRLRTLNLRSRLEFSDTVFLDMILSRVQAGARDRFTCVLGILPHWTEGRRMDDAVIGQLRELAARGDLGLILPGSQ